MSDEARSDELEGIASEGSEIGGAERYRVRLPVFEGPLDLLLHLIKTHEIDILDIPIAFVTQKYLEYLDLMRVLNLDVAGEYLLMAATLGYIKSKMLLPRPVEVEEDEEAGDPRADLVRRLLEYQKYKEAAARLAARHLLYRDVFPRAVSPEDAPREDAPLAEVSVFQLLEAFAEVLERAGQDLAHEITIDRMSVTERIQQLVAELAAVEKVELTVLLAGIETRPMLVVTLLALLEMARLRMVRLFQAEARGAIWITSTGVAGTAASGEDSFAYRTAAPEPVPQPRPLTDEERALVERLEQETRGLDDEEDDDPQPEY